jgi:hypothetical protein
MSVLGHLYSPDPTEQANTIAMVLMGKYDEALEAAFVHTHGEAGEGMAAQLKEHYRSTLQDAINQEADKMTKQTQEEACEKFMGNQEPHALGTVAELALKYDVSKTTIRKHKRDGTLEAFISERAD